MFFHPNELPQRAAFRGLVQQTKPLFFLFILLLCGIGAAQAQATDKTNLGQITIPEQNAEWEVKRRMGAQAPPPLTMKGKNGQPLPPNQTLTVKGKTVTNQAFFNELNTFERNINRNGFTIRNKPGADRIVYAAPKGMAQINQQVNLTPSQGQLLSNAEILARNTEEYKAGNIIVKPTSRYSAQEFTQVRKNAVKVQGASLVASESNPGANAPAGTLHKNFNYNKSQNWSFGSAGKFLASFSASAKLSGKYYQPAGKEDGLSQEQIKAAIGATQTEFNFEATAKASGAILNKPINVLNGKAVAYLPANSSKKAKVTLLAQLAGITVLNVNKEFSTNFDETGRKSKQHAWGREYNTTILGVPVSGEIGVRGEIGFEYSLKGTLPYSVQASCKPYATITGYAEAAVDAFIAEAGVSASLNFIKGHVTIAGSAGFAVLNNVALWTNLNASYNLEFLSGRLSVYVETPDICPVFDCSYRHDWDIWNWSGIKRTGSFVDERSINVYNW